MNSPLKLTRRQCEILRLTAAGQYTKQIAKTLGVRPHTVRSQLKEARARVGAETVSQLFIWYGQRGAIVEDRRGVNQHTKEAAA